LVVLYDDTGMAAWSPYGGRINMPTMDRLAADGLTYTQWHTTALCSPTRSCFLTGRNHHQNGFASISEASTGYPGYNSHIPRENATVATVLRNAGYGKLTYAYNFLGIPPEQRVTIDVPTEGRHVLGVDFVKERLGEYHESYGTLSLYVDDEIRAKDEIRTMTGHFSLCGEGLCIGYDSGDAVSSEYTPKFEFTGGRIVKVVFDIADDAYVDVERHIAAAMMRD
jgi:arylsulfatase A-like enzyme